MTTVAIDQALVQSFINGRFGLPIAYENSQYEPQGSQPYVELVVLQGEIDPYTLHDTDISTGVMNCILRYPTNTGAIPAKRKAAEIIEYYFPGRRFIYNSLAVEITNRVRAFNRNEDGWYQIMVQISYTIRLPRPA